MTDGVHADSVILARNWLFEAEQMREPDATVGNAVMELRTERADVLEKCARELLDMALDNAS